jgi:hypothetical protein
MSIATLMTTRIAGRRAAGSGEVTPGGLEEPIDALSRDR